MSIKNSVRAFVAEGDVAGEASLQVDRAMPRLVSLHHRELLEDNLIHGDQRADSSEHEFDRRKKLVEEHFLFWRKGELACLIVLGVV